jgi:hypothetical protein
VRLHVRSQDIDRAREVLADTLPIPDTQAEPTWRWIGAFFVVLALMILLGMYYRDF